MRLKKNFSLVFAVIFFFSQAGWGLDYPAPEHLLNDDPVSPDTHPAAPQTNSPAKLHDDSDDSGVSQSKNGETVIFKGGSPSAEPKKFTYKQSASEIGAECVAASAALKSLDCNQRISETAVSSGGPGASGAADGSVNTFELAEQAVKGASERCTAATFRETSECEKVKSTIEKEKIQCITSAKNYSVTSINEYEKNRISCIQGAQSATSELIRTAIEKNCNANWQPLIQKANGPVFNDNQGLCQNSEKDLLAKVESEKKGMDLTKIAMVAAVGAALIMLLKNKNNSKKASSDVSAVAQTPTPTSASNPTSQSQCAAGDRTCQCASSQNYRPVSCDNSCAVNGSPNSRCLANKYGSDWGSKSFDQGGAIVPTPSTSTASNGTGTTSSSGSSSDGSGSSSGLGSASGTSGDVGVKSSSGEISSNNKGTGSVAEGQGEGFMAAGGSGYGSGSRTTASEDFPNSPYKKGLPNGAKIAANSDRAQIAPANSNLFQNISNRYRLKSLDLIP